MRLARHLAVLGAIPAIRVIELTLAAALQTWTRPVALATGLAFWAMIAVPLWALFAALRLTRLDVDKAFAVAAWFAVGFTNWPLVRLGLEAIMGRDPVPLGVSWVGVAVVVGFALWAGGRVDATGTLVSLFVLALLGIRVVGLIGGLEKLVEPAPLPAEASIVIPSTTPSVWVIVLDAHPSPAVLREYYEVDLEDDLSRLRALGLRVWDDARSNYTHTTASVPALLGGTVFPGNLTGEMPQLLAGLQADTPLTRSFSEAGYEVRMLSAPWSRSECGEVVDLCVDVSMDERRHFLLRTTPLTDLVPRLFGHPMPLGGRTVLQSVADLDARPRHFTFVHSTVSHIPFMLDENCVVDTASPEPMAAQLRCSHRLLRGALDHIDLGRDIVVVAADHGYGWNGQFGIKPAEWDVRQARERFGSFLAVSDPAGCADGLPDRLSTSEVLPMLLACHGVVIDVPEPVFVGMEEGDWGAIVEHTFAWDGWSTTFDTGS